MRRLPPQQSSGPYRIAMVCLGNICRSPVADVVMNDLVAASPLAGRVLVDSCGTAGWHVGKPMDERSAHVLTEAGHDATRHRARQFHPSMLRTHDLVLAMDRSNLADLGGATDRVRLFREWDPAQPGGEVPDPYYGGDEGFEEVLAMVDRTCRTLLADLRAALDSQTGADHVPGGAGR